MDFGMPPRDRAEPILLSTSQMIRYRDEKRTLRFTLVNGETVEGNVTGFDAESYNVTPKGGTEGLTLLKHAVLYYRASPE